MANCKYCQTPIQWQRQEGRNVATVDGKKHNCRTQSEYKSDGAYFAVPPALEHRGVKVYVRYNGYLKDFECWFTSPAKTPYLNWNFKSHEEAEQWAIDTIDRCLIPTPVKCAFCGSECAHEDHTRYQKYCCKANPNHRGQTVGGKIYWKNIEAQPTEYEEERAS